MVPLSSMSAVTEQRPPSIRSAFVSRKWVARPVGRGGESAGVVSPRSIWTTVALVFAGLSGCSGGSFLPGGPHMMDSARLAAIVRTYSSANAVDAKLVNSVIQSESHGDPSAVSRVGAQGLMQLMPGTSAMYGVANPFDPYENVDAGTRYLHDLLHRYKGNVRLALAAYNAGPGAVDAAHGVPRYAETRAYVDRVVAGLR
ncbi:MAG: lytic transglycosylase domain-containing protein [Candidatus Eremiobacteraeota bacterium]|nr:lytic transglycosylase domain-containing protein [Candidatus Eremiobacteraeota bacterium]MBV9409541.1 lytic transglycosylase domain-containing protein [Candidatus Eremiobacteraeota bacterium]